MWTSSPKIPVGLSFFCYGFTLSCRSISMIVVYDWNHYFGLGPIPKLKPKMADTFGQYRNQPKPHLKGRNVVGGIFSILKASPKRFAKLNLVPNMKYTILYICVHFQACQKNEENIRKIKLKIFWEKNGKKRFGSNSHAEIGPRFQFTIPKPIPRHNWAFYDPCIVPCSRKLSQTLSSFIVPVHDRIRSYRMSNFRVGRYVRKNRT